jgi:hypothetical protein
MGSVGPEQGYYSILRWRADVTRDEARNVAVLLVDDDGTSGGIKAAPISRISPKLQEQGLLDSMLAGLELRFDGVKKPDLRTLEQLHASMRNSLYLTEPRPTAVFDVDQTLSALFRAYVQPRSGAPNTLTKGAILDNTIKLLRRRGLEVHRGHRLGEFFFDVVVDSEEPIVPRVIEVLSFAAGKKEPVPSVLVGGVFLFGLVGLVVFGLGMLVPPGSQASDSVVESFHRVNHWLTTANVESFSPADLKEGRIEALNAD